MHAKSIRAALLLAVSCRGAITRAFWAAVAVVAWCSIAAAQLSPGGGTVTNPNIVYDPTVNTTLQGATPLVNTGYSQNTIGPVAYPPDVDLGTGSCSANCVTTSPPIIGPFSTQGLSWVGFTILQAPAGSAGFVEASNAPDCLTNLSSSDWSGANGTAMSLDNSASNIGIITNAIVAGLRIHGPVAGRCMRIAVTVYPGTGTIQIEGVGHGSVYGGGIGQIAGGVSLLNSSAGLSKVITNTPTVTASAYSANMSIGGLRSLGVFRTTTQPTGVVNSFQIVSKGGITASEVVYAFSQNPSSTCTDHTAFALSAADAPFLVPGFPVTITPASLAGTSQTMGTASVNAHASNADGTATANLYFCVVTTGTPTPTSTTDLVLNIAMTQD